MSDSQQNVASMALSLWAQNYGPYPGTGYPKVFLIFLLFFFPSYLILLIRYLFAFIQYVNARGDTKLRMDNSRKLAWKHPTRGSLVGVVSTHSFVFIFPFIYPVLLVLFLFYSILFLIVVDVAGWGADGQAVSVYFLLNTTSYPVC